MMDTVGLPSGTLSFLLSDVEGSTALWEAEREGMAVALRRSLEIVEKVAAAHGGVLPVEQGEGDSRLAAFPRAADALTAALAIQRAMAEEPWPERVQLRVRIAVHAGDARLRDERTYAGGVVHRAARLRGLARGGQVLVSRAVHDLVADELPGGMELVDLGRHRLRETGESNSDAGATYALCFALADHGRPLEALEELASGEELFARRPGWFTEVTMAAARAFVLSSIEDDEAAAVAAQRCITGGQEVGIPTITLYGVLVLAAVERRRGDFAVAAETLTRADDAITKGVRLSVPDIALEWARLSRAAGRPDRAEDDAHAALVAAVEMGFGKTTVLTLEELAHLSASAGSGAEAARLLGACRTARQTKGLVPTVEERRWIDGTTTSIVALLGDDAADAFKAGEELSLDEAVAYARRARGERGRPAAGWGALTPTERQVVDLVVDGLTNPQIAERLLMSRGTVKAHLAHVFTKLAVANRAELAAVATRHSRPALRLPPPAAPADRWTRPGP